MAHHRPKAFWKNRLFIREKYVKARHKEAFTYKFIEKSYDEMFGEYVNIERKYLSYERLKIKGKKWIGFNSGDADKIKRVFGKDFKIIDRRAKPKMKYKLKYRAKLKSEQQTVADFWLDKRGFGIVHAPVRWGKTYLTGYLIVKSGTTCLILMDKSHLCKQWVKDLRKMTNIKKLEAKYGKKIVGVMKKSGKGYKTYPITLATFQRAWSAEKRCKFISKNRDRFGFVWADECHHSPAYTYAKSIVGWNAFHKGGVSGTIKRRDNKHLLMHDIIGNITAEGTTEQLDCKVVRHMTDYAANPRANWTSMVSAVVKNDQLNDEVCEMVAKQARSGRFVLIHTERTKHCKVLKDKIHESDPNLAVEIMHGGVKLDERDRIIKSMNKGDTNVIIGTKVIQEGITLARADMIHVGFSPVTNEELWKQISGRVRTPFEGKPKPVIHDWRLKGHGGLYASGKVRDKYWEARKWEVETKYSNGPGRGDDDDLGAGVPKICGNCKFFFECKKKEGVRAKSEICKDFTPHKIESRQRLDFVLKNAKKAGLSKWYVQFAKEMQERQSLYWSTKQHAILNQAFHEVLNARGTRSFD